MAVRSAKANSEYEPAKSPVNPPADGSDAIMAVCSDCYCKQRSTLKKKKKDSENSEWNQTEVSIELIQF